MEEFVFGEAVNENTAVGEKGEGGGGQRPVCAMCYALRSISFQQWFR